VWPSESLGLAWDMKSERSRRVSVTILCWRCGGAEKEDSDRRTAVSGKEHLKPGGTLTKETAPVERAHTAALQKDRAGSCSRATTPAGEVFFRGPTGRRRKKAFWLDDHRRSATRQQEAAFLPGLLRTLLPTYRCTCSVESFLGCSVVRGCDSRTRCIKAGR